MSALSSADANKQPTISPFQTKLNAFIGRHTKKTFDWDAFPNGRGYPELDRGQMRYIGAGGSPKANDPTTLKPGAFTLSLVTQPVGKYAPSHAHEVVEHFLVLQGVLTVGWVYGDEVIEAKLGPGDLVLNKLGRPHGFRNDGPEQVLMSISVGSGTPLDPVYVFHPEGKDPAQARAFGATEGKTVQLNEVDGDWRHQEYAAYLMRRRDRTPIWSDAGFCRMVYVGDGAATPERYRADLIHLPRGVAVKEYLRESEDVYLVLKGFVTVGWKQGNEIVEERLGPKDVIYNPAGQLHYFRNDGLEDAEFLMVVGTPDPENVEFKRA